MAVTSTSNLTNTVDSINNISKALDFAMPYLAYAMFGQQDDIAKRAGKTIKWYRHAVTTEITAPRSEGSGWAPTTHSVDSVTANLTKYGDGRQITEELDVQTVFDLREDLRVWAGESAGKSINAVTRNTLTAAVPGGNKVYANNKAVGTVTSGDTPALSDFLKAAQNLKDQDAPAFMIDNQPVYVAIISPTVERILMASQSFRDAVQFNKSDRRFAGYIGTIDGICYVRSSTANNATATINTVLMDQSLVFGRGAFGVPGMPLYGGSGMLPAASGVALGAQQLEEHGATLSKMFQILVTLPGDGNGGGAHGDEFGEYYKIAWKAFWATVVLNSNWLYAVISARV